MDYTKLATELLAKMRSLHKARSQRGISESLQGEAFVLHYVAYHDGGVLPGDISQEMGVSSARIATALNRLEDKGFVTRQIDRGDRRRILVDVTKEGRDVAKKHWQSMLGATENMLKFLGEHDAKEYVRIKSKLADMISECKEAP